MIKDVADWDQCVEEVNTCRDELLVEGRETGPMMLGCVVDMPSAAVMAGGYDGARRAADGCGC